MAPIWRRKARCRSGRILEWSFRKRGLAAAVQRLKPQLPPAAVGEVVHVVTTPTETSLGPKKCAFHRLLMDGAKVEFTNAQGEKETDHAQLIGFRDQSRTISSR